MTTGNHRNSPPFTTVHPSTPTAIRFEIALPANAGAIGTHEPRMFGPDLDTIPAWVGTRVAPSEDRQYPAKSRSCQCLRASSHCDL
jgi:hypothetical protein